MNILNIVTTPRREKSASTAVVNAFLSEYRERVRDVTVDRLDIWQEQLPEFDSDAINAKYKGVSGESMTQVEMATWEKIREWPYASSKQTASSWACPCGISPSLTNSSS